MTVLGLHFCVRAFSSCGKRGPLFIAVCGPLTIAASLVAEHRLQTRRLSNVAHGPSRFAACGILPDQGSNPRPLHWQADSQPLRYQGSPVMHFLMCKTSLGNTFTYQKRYIIQMDSSIKCYLHHALSKLKQSQISIRSKHVVFHI